MSLGSSAAIRSLAMSAPILLAGTDGQSREIHVGAPCARCPTRCFVTARQIEQRAETSIQSVARFELATGLFDLSGLEELLSLLEQHLRRRYLLRCLRPAVTRRPKNGDHREKDKSGAHRARVACSCL